MNNDKKVTFTDIFANSKTSSEEEPKTFSSVVKENEDNNNVTLDKLLENKEDKKEVPTEEPSLKSSNIFQEAINTTENEEKEDEVFEKKEETLQSESIDFNNLSNMFSPKEESTKINEEIFSNEATIDNKITEELTIKEDSKELQEENNNSFFNEIKEQEDTANENIFTNNEANDDNIGEKETTPIEENIEPSTQENNLFFSINETSGNEEKQIEKPSSKEETKEQEVKNNNIFFSNTETEQEESNELKDDIFSNSINFDTKEKNEQKIEDNPFFKTEEKLESEPVKETPKEKIKPEKKENEYKETSPFFADEFPKTEQQDNNPFFNNSINLVEDTKTTHTPQTNIDLSNTKHYNVKVVKKKEPLIKFIIGVLSYALFILLLLIGITLLVYVADIKIRAAKGDYTPPKYNAYVVLTGSMLPEIQVYDVVVTKKTESSELKEGDVITFASSDSRFAGTIITHRIIKKNYDADKNTYTFQTKGDNNNVADSALVESNNIYGKVILKIPKLGYLQEFLATDGGWIIVILIPCLAVMSYDIVKLAKGLKNKKRKKLKVQKK